MLQTKPKTTKSQIWLRLLLHVACVLCGLLLHVPASLANMATQTPDKLEVALITYGPGALYWEHFGHDALEIRDTESGEAINFNYGVFDFAQKNFVLNFARGRMRYSMDAVPSSREIAFYTHFGRSAVRQKLNLTAEQRGTLRDYLLHNYAPDNRDYRYDYFTQNCATKVRDAIDVAMDGALRQALSRKHSDVTYRSETRRLLADMPALMLMLDLGLSAYADQPLNAWQASFIPMQLMQQLQTANLLDGTPVISSQTTLASAAQPVSTLTTSRLLRVMTQAGMTLALLLLALCYLANRRRWARYGFAVLSSAWLLASGLVGLLMLGLWLATDHQSAWANENLLLFSPLSLALVTLPWRRTARTWMRIVLLWLAASAVIALAVKALPHMQQMNALWIGFALPVILSLVGCLLYRTRATAAA